MARSSLPRGLLFALLSGALAFPVVGWLGSSQAITSALYLLACVVIYPLFVAESPRRGFSALALAGALSLPVLLFASKPLVVVTLALSILALCRSACLSPRPLARALVYELSINGLALFTAALLYDRSLVGNAFAHWTFWLLQAGALLVPASARRTAEPPVDPFERAHAAALAVLERRGG